MHYLNHVTMNTGHNRRSFPAEVKPHIIEWLTPWLKKLLNEPGVYFPFLAEDLADKYYAKAKVEDGALVLTVYSQGLAYYRDAPSPLMTMGVCERSRQAKPLWDRMLVTYGMDDAPAMPEPPYLAVVLHPTAYNDAEAMVWMGDFERCVAWTWIEMNKGTDHE